MILFNKKIHLKENTYWIGFNDKGQPLFETTFYSKGMKQRVSRWPNTTTDLSPGQDGAWSMNEDGLGGSTCTGITNTGTTEQLTDTHSLEPAIFSEGALDFDTSSIPDTDTITSVTLKIYRNSFSKSKTLDTNYSVGYYSLQGSLSSPMSCTDRSLTWTSEGSGNWANTTGYFNKTIATTSINLTGHTTFRLIPNWLHVADTLF